LIHSRTGKPQVASYRKRSRGNKRTEETVHGAGCGLTTAESANQDLSQLAHWSPDRYWFQWFWLVRVEAYGQPLTGYNFFLWRKQQDYVIFLIFGYKSYKRTNVQDDCTKKLRKQKETISNKRIYPRRKGSVLLSSSCLNFYHLNSALEIAQHL
jgi:hypothetical protein